MNPADQPHRRRNLLTGDWVLVSPQRGQRPWQGSVSAPTPDRGLAHDPSCYLCPGNVRANGTINPVYPATFVFANDFPALLHEDAATNVALPASQPFETSSAAGVTRVICYSPDHSATLAAIGEPALRSVIDCWCDQSAELGRTYDHVQIFENKGAQMGCSSPHPHGQVWAGNFVPSEVAREDTRQRDWFAAGGTSLLGVVADSEIAVGERVVLANPLWIAVVPHWASWPFEVLIVARAPVGRLEELGDEARLQLAALLARLLAAYDKLFGVSFPYSMGWHGAPHALGDDTAHWRLHAHFYPPLLRSAGIRKFMVGFEMLAEAQRDLTPEAAAARLRDLL